MKIHPALTASAVQPLSATPVVALAALLLIIAVAIVLLISFYLHRRSVRRTPPR